MIDLTPIDIRKKKGDFPRGLRGYNPADVDLFLDLVADRLEEVVGEMRHLEERAFQLEEQIRYFRDRERALTDALVSAQSLREEMRRQATTDAELLRREAEGEAERIRVGALRAVEREEDVLRRLRARRAQALDTFRAFLERELAEVIAMSESAAPEPALPELTPADFERALANLDPAPFGTWDDGASDEDAR